MSVVMSLISLLKAAPRSTAFIPFTSHTRSLRKTNSVPGLLVKLYEECVSDFFIYWPSSEIFTFAFN